MPVTEKYTSDPPPIPAGIELRVYSNPICPFAQVDILRMLISLNMFYATAENGFDFNS